MRPLMNIHDNLNFSFNLGSNIGYWQVLKLSVCKLNLEIDDTISKS